MIDIVHLLQERRLVLLVLGLDFSPDISSISLQTHSFRSKIRCQGERPSCSSCQKRHLICAYDSTHRRHRQNLESHLLQLSHNLKMLTIRCISKSSIMLAFFLHPVGEKPLSLVSSKALSIPQVAIRQIMTQLDISRSFQGHLLNRPSEMLSKTLPWIQI
jgi:hypothetical protein